LFFNIKSRSTKNYFKIDVKLYPAMLTLLEFQDSQSESMYDCHLPDPPSPVHSESQESVSRKRKVSIPTVPMQNPAASPMLKPKTQSRKYEPSENGNIEHIKLFGLTFRP
jgi:hypothetical protein